MGYKVCCLLCNSSVVGSALISSGHGKSEELSDLFEVFCDYMKLNEDEVIEDEYQGKLFPFCSTCSFQVYQLFDYHKEKVRILQLLSQMVTSMTTLVLESQAQELLSSGTPEEMDPATRKLAVQIGMLRKCVINSYSPKVLLKDTPIREAATVPIKFKGIARRSSKKEISPSRDLDQVKVDVSDMDTDYYEPAFDSMELEWGPNGDENDTHDAAGTDQEKGVKRDLSKDGFGTKAPGLPASKSLVGRKNRLYHRHVQISDSTYSLLGYTYKDDGGLFTCNTCLRSLDTREKIHSHLLKCHINAIPRIPTRSLEDYETDEKDTFILGNRYLFRRRAEDGLFRCSSCHHTTRLWSRMYLHIYIKHSGAESGAKGGRSLRLTRPVGEVKKLSENLYEYFGNKYSVSEVGLYTCESESCGQVRQSLVTMQAHLKNMHVDHLHQYPQKCLEEYQIANNLYCLSRKYMFEKTGDSSWECVVPDCDAVKPTWEEMYTHIWADHWKLEKRVNTSTSFYQFVRDHAKKYGSAEGGARPTSDDESDTEAAAGTSSSRDRPQGEKAEIKSRGHRKPKKRATASNQPKVESMPSLENAIGEGCRRRTSRNVKRMSYAKLLKGVQESSEEEEEKVAVTEPNDNSMDTDYNPEGVEEDDNAELSSQNEPSDSDNSGSDQTVWSETEIKKRRGRPSKKVKVEDMNALRLKYLEQRTRRWKTSTVKIAEGTYSLGIYLYKEEDGKFSCETCGVSKPRKGYMHRHIMEWHINYFPFIPVSGLEDFKVSENKYLVANKYFFKKKGERLFQCSSCSYTAPLWTAMYAHIWSVHRHHNHQQGDSKDVDRRIRLRRAPRGRRKISETEFEFQGFRYTVLEHGSHKCGSCGKIIRDVQNLFGHIRSVHLDYLPPSPEKSPEEYQIGPGVFCLSNKFLFEHTGENTFECSCEECYAVTSTWEEMYAHVYLKHLKTKIPRVPKSMKRASSGTVAVQGTSSLDGTDRAAADSTIQSGLFPVKYEPETQLPALSPIPGPSNHNFDESLLPPSLSTEDTQIPMEDAEGKDRPPGDPGGNKSLEVNGESEKSILLELPPQDLAHLADLEVAPGRYSYNGFEFRVENGLFHCSSCVQSFELKTRMLMHISVRHCNNDGFVEVRPNELLYDNKYPSTRDEDGKYRCRVEGCDFVTCRQGLTFLKAHILKRHIGAPAPARYDKAEDWAVKRQEMLQSKLSKYEVGPSKYVFRGFGFTSEDGKYICDTCGKIERLFILRHLDTKHVQPTLPQRRRYPPQRVSRMSRPKLVEVAANEFILGDDERLRGYKLENDKYRCGLCDMELKTAQNLKGHFENQHSNAPVVCDVCGKLYKHTRYLTMHIERCHAGDDGEGHSCPKCNKTFPTKVANAFHLKKAHQPPKPKTDERPFVCDQCGKTFKFGKSLKDHVALHHVEVKPTFPCPICSKVFFNPASVSVHTKVVHGNQDKPTHPCPVCKKEFKYRETIRRHIMVVHEGKKSSEVYKRAKRPSTKGKTRAPKMPQICSTTDNMEEGSDEQYADEDPLDLFI